MRYSSFELLALLSCSLLLLSGRAQQPPQRDAQAVQAVSGCIAASGGIAAIERLRASSITSGTLQEVSQDGTRSSVKTFTWIVSQEDFRRELSDGRITKAFVSGHGSPGITSSHANPLALDYHVARAALPFYLPGLVLLNELRNPSYTIAFAGQTIVEGKAALHIHTSDDSDKAGKTVTPQEWFLDSATLLPLRVEYRLPSNENAADYEKGAFEFIAFTQQIGVVVPTQLAYYEGDQLKAALLIESISVSPDLSAYKFDLPNVGGAQ